MKDILIDVIDRLKRGEYKSEEHVRLSLVCRLLDKLGWNIWKPNEVFTEYQAVRREDASRVDIALFMPPELLRPAVFVEVKAVGKLLPALDSAELQLRDYNRTTQADISLLTDGQHWRFYLSGAAGEFRERCFEKLDFLSEESTLDDIELALDAFLSKAALENRTAVEEAKKYLKRSDSERIMFEVLPLAQRDAEDDPSLSQVTCFQRRCRERGVDCDEDRALAFMKHSRTKSIGLATTTSSSNALNVSTSKTPSRTSLGAPKAIRTPGAQLVLVNKRGANAVGQFSGDSGQFVVFKGSLAAEPTARFEGGYRNLYSRLVNERILVEEPNAGQTVFRLSRDYEFSSPSAAASVLCGRQANDGEWKKRNA